MLKLTKASVSVHVEKPGVLTLRLKPPEAPPPFLRPQLSHARHPKPLPYVPRALRPQRTRLRPVVVRPPQSPSQPLYHKKTRRQWNCPHGSKNKRTSTSGSHPLAESITLHCTGSELVESANAVVPLKSLAMSNVPLAIASAHGKHHPSPLDGNTNASALLYMAVNKTRRQVNRIAHTNIIKIHSPAMSSRVASSPSRAVTTSTLAS